MFPEGWHYCSLESVAAITDCKHRTPPYVAEGIPVISPGTIKWGPLDLETPTKRVSKKEYETLMDHCSVDKGDLVMSRNQSLGVASYVTCDDPFVLGQDTVLIKPTSCDGHFLFYCLQSGTSQRMIYRLAGGSTFSRINLSELRALEILMPPLAEQHAIANILAAWDLAIEQTGKLITNSEAQQQALMQKLLSGKKRLSGYEGQWKTSRLDEIATRVTRRNDGGDHPILTISSTAGFVAQKDKYSRYMAGKSVENYILLERGEFAYNKGNSKTYQFGCIFDLDTFDVALVPHVYVCFRLKPGMSPRFFKYLFAFDYLRSQLGQLVNTGVRNNGLLNITARQFLATTVPVPSIDEQEAIADIMAATTKQADALRRNLSALKEEKAALMRQLLDGRIRMKNMSDAITTIGSTR
jgi:type I restriction enzyme S subunit